MIIQFFKKSAKTVFATSQRVLLPIMLTILYFVGFGLFTVVGRILAKRDMRKTRISENSAWHTAQYKQLTIADLERQS